MEESKIQKTAVFMAVALNSGPSLVEPDQEKNKKKKPAFSVQVVQAVSSWALYFAFLYGSVAAHNMHGHSTCHQPSWWSSCYFLAGAAADEATKLRLAVLWCCVAQVATAVLALLLVAGRSCCHTVAVAVSFVPLALALANHSMNSRIDYLLLTAYPWDSFLITAIVVTFFDIFVDLLAFLPLIILGRDDADQE